MRKAVQYAIENRLVTYFLVVILFLGGIASFRSLGQLEDPTFSVKTAVVSTTYPGAGPKEVELEVTDRLERAIQEMPQIKNLYSTSKAGSSTIRVDIKEQYWSDQLPQVWDELRKKIEDVIPELPPGVEKPVVSDDFGFVYGFLLALTGDGFTPRDLEYYADSVKKELSLVKGVSRVELWGVQPQVIYLDISEKKLQELGISIHTIKSTLSTQNVVVNAGSTDQDKQRFRIAPTGEFLSPEEIGELNIRPGISDIVDTYFTSTTQEQRTINRNRAGYGTSGVSSAKILKLKDIATIRRGYLDPPMTQMRYNGKPAIGIALAGLEDENIVHVGHRINKRIEEIMEILPIGIAINKIAWQSDVVDESVQAFIANLIAAVVIVLIVLVIPSGLRMGFIIGFDLILTILGTFIFMSIQDIPLQRMSLGALIIALGMMVDNAIVISDTIAVKIRQGKDRIEAAIDSAVSSAYPLFAATLVAVMAFYPIYASTTGAGEYCQTLFTVVAAALIISWLVAMFITPLQCIDLLPEPKEKTQKAEKIDDEYQTGPYRFFRKVLRSCIHFRFLTMAVMFALLITSIWGFGYVKQMFFPDSSRPQMMVDYWGEEGSRFQYTAENLHKLEEKFLESPLVQSTSSFIGAGPPRFYLPVDPEGVNSSYGQVVVNFNDYRDINTFIDTFKPWAEKQFPNAMIRFRKYGVGPADTWKFEARVSGPATADLKKVRSLGIDIANISRKSPYGTDWRLDIRNRTLKIVPHYSQKKARLADISREDLAATTLRGFDGQRVGLYREKDKLLPIVFRNIEEERREFLDRFDVLQVQPSKSTRFIPLSQAISKVDTEWEDPIIVRWNRRRAVTVQGAPKEGITFPTLQRNVIDEIHQMELPAGYEIFWDGEAFSTKESQESLVPGMLPAAITIIFIIVTIFNAYRPLIIILGTIPFAVIGITIGLLGLNTPFGFLALLGAMSLAGMMNKNIVVLLDACEENLKNGMSRYDAILEASVTRVRPVLLAAGTTVLGVVPLVSDIFWTAMAVTIMAGLSFGSILTLIIVPVFYSILYKVKESS